MRFIRREKLLASRKAKIASRIASRITGKLLGNRRFDIKKSGSFLQRCKCKSVLELSNSNTNKMVDVEQAMTINFQEEIIMEILSRLPVRSLLQFKCVSKFWNMLISDPYFKRMHLKRAKNDPNFEKFILSRRDDYGKTSCYCCPLSSNQIIKDAQELVCPLSAKQLFRIHCSFDGMVILEVYNGISDCMLLLWNPSTNESIVLPRTESKAEELPVIGLGYDSTSDDYKILKINSFGFRGEYDDYESRGEILAMKGGSWKKIHQNGISNMLENMHNLAFIHEAFHWIGSSNNFSLVSFNISDEVYGEIPLPAERLWLVGKVTLGVTVLDGMLCVYSSTLGHWSGATFKLWAMKEYGVKDTWSALFMMEDPLFVLVVPKYKFADGEVLFWCVFRGCNEFCTSRGPLIELQPRVTIQKGFVFTESLISPRSLAYYG